jgi:predicted nuclease of predicted toxin-antitoxin system
MEIRFHLDESCNPAIARVLRGRGIDVTTSAEAGLLRASDEAQLKFALSENRVLVTHDADFLRLNAANVPHAGIAYCHPESRSIGKIIRQLVLIWEILEPEEVSGRVEWL